MISQAPGVNFNLFAFEGIQILNQISRVPCGTVSLYCLQLDFLRLPGGLRNLVSGLGGNFDDDATNDSLATPPLVPDSDNIALCAACGRATRNTENAQHQKFPLDFVTH